MNFIFCKRILTRALKHDFYLQLTKRCVINSLNKGGGGGRRRGAFAVKRIAGKENGREENGTDQGNRKIHNFFVPSAPLLPCSVFRPLPTGCSPQDPSSFIQGVSCGEE